MSTRSVIAVPNDAGKLRGRYVHSDGYPTYMGARLHELVARDGLETVRRVLTQDWHGWSSIDSLIKASAPKFRRSASTVAVAGYGTAYHHDDQPDEWIEENESAGTEWAYGLMDDGMSTYALDLRDESNRWTHVVDIPWSTATPDLMPMLIAAQERRSHAREEA